jgi:hypothetical protein
MRYLEVNLADLLVLSLQETVSEVLHHVGLLQEFPHTRALARILMNQTLVLQVFAVLDPGGEHRGGDSLVIRNVNHPDGSIL